MSFNFTLSALASFDAVASEGSFQAAAVKLNRTHPSVYAAVKGLERQLGLALLDRRGYRVALTDAGRSFQQRVRELLADAHALTMHANRIARGEESEMTIVIGDLCKTERLLASLKDFFKRHPRTRFHLRFESLSGPWERLLSQEADLIVHHIDKADAHFEFVDLYPIKLIPVVARGFLPRRTRSITPQALRSYTQVVIRDSARYSAPRNYYLLEGAPSCTVGDQLTKKELITLGVGWGHLPDFMIEDDLRAGRLQALTNRHFKGGVVEIVAARLRDPHHGPVAERLWKFVASHARDLG